MASLQDLFLQGDNWFTQLIGGLNTNINVKEYIPYNPSLLSYSKLDQIYRTNAQIAHIKSLWFANIGRHGHTVTIDRDISERSKDRYQKQIKNFLYSDLDWPKLQNKVLSLLFDEGNAIVRIEDKKIKIESLRRYTVEYSQANDLRRYIMKATKEIYYNNDEFYHIQDPYFEHWPVAPARINLPYMFLLLEMHGVKANSNIFAKGGIGVTILSPDSEMAEQLNQPATNAKGETVASNWLKELWAGVTQTKNANTIKMLNGIKNVWELGKDNKEMQFENLIGKIAPERINWAYNVTSADLGSGDNTTYNNTQTYSYVLYEKVGRVFENALDRLVNNFILPYYQFPTTLYGDISAKYKKPANPTRIKDQEQARQDWLANIITLNEYRDSQDKPAIENGDVFYLEWIRSMGGSEQSSDGTGDGTEFVKKKYSLTDEGLNSKLFTGTKKKKGFLQKWERAINQQIDAFITDFEKVNDVKTYKVQLPKLESFYSFPSLSDDLSRFAKIGVDDFQNDKRIKFKKQKYILEGLPEIIKESVRFRTIALLKGVAEAKSEIDNPLINKWVGLPSGFVGVDEQTTKQIQTFISNNSDKPVPEIIEALQEIQPDMAFHRAEVIARTEVSNAIEGNRYIMYEQEFGDGTTHKWITAGDERVGDDHRLNDGITLPLGDKFPSGDTRVGQRPNCRCESEIYPPDHY